MPEVVLVDKVLSATDVKYRLAYPTDALQAFHFSEQQLSVKFQAIDYYSHKTWNLKLKIRRPGDPHREYHPKPEVSGDWLKFVAEKKLKEGNKIILTSEVDEANNKVYKIIAQMKLLGVWCEIKDV